MSPDFCVQLPWDLAGLPLVQQALEAHAQAHEWDDALLARMQLVAEELVVNTMTHGDEGPRQDKGPGWVRIEVTEADGCITMVITDNGTPYDPTVQVSPNLDATLDERGPGGLGVHLIREMTDSLQHAWVNGCNVVTVRKQRAGAA